MSVQTVTRKFDYSRLSTPELIAQISARKYRTPSLDAMRAELRSRPIYTPPPAPVQHSCDGCAGDGIYWLRNGSAGTCFRCSGKGWQNEADKRRNWGYDQNMLKKSRRYRSR